MMIFFFDIFLNPWFSLIFNNIIRVLVDNFDF
jgi:hypothetical protein